jgi:hypothetical protein
MQSWRQIRAVCTAALFGCDPLCRSRRNQRAYLGAGREVAARVVREDDGRVVASPLPQVLVEPAEYPIPVIGGVREAPTSRMMAPPLRTGPVQPAFPKRAYRCQRPPR